MKVILLFVSVMCFSTIANSALAQACSSGVSADPSRRNALDLMAAPIKSRTDLDRYMERTPKSDSPIEWLSADARSRFLDSLVFNENGLVGYEYADLVEELPASRIYTLLSLFGAQHTISLLEGLRVESDSDKAVVGPPDCQDEAPRASGVRNRTMVRPQ